MLARPHMSPHSWAAGFLVALALVAAVAASAEAASEEDTLVARVGTHPVTLAEFRRSWSRLMLQERPQGSTPLDRYRSFLDDIVVRQLLAAEASLHPKKLLPAQEETIEEYRENLMRNRLFDVEVIDSLNLDTVDYTRLRDELTHTVDMRAFLFDDEGAARAWYTRLVSGTPVSRLESLAQSGDPTAPRLVDLGRRFREQVTDSVAAVVFRLAPGRFSPPMPEWGVYAIYHVTRRGERPNSVADSPATLRNQALQLFGNDARERYRRRLGQEMGIRYNNAGLDTIVNRFAILPPRVETTETGGGNVQAFLPIPALLPSDSTLVLARTRDLQVTGRDLILFLEATPAYARPEVRNRAQLIPWVDRVAFDHELLRRARARGLDRDPTVVRELERRREGFQVEMLYADSVEAHVTFPEDSLRAIYQADSTRFNLQETAKVWAMSTEQESEARGYLEAVKSGANADSIARRYSTDPQSAARGGVSDWFRMGMTPNANVEEAIFATPIGGFGGPLRTSDGWTIFQVLDKQGGETRTFELVRNQLMVDFRPREEERLMVSFMNRLRARHEVVLYPENLSFLEHQLQD